MYWALGPLKLIADSIEGFLRGGQYSRRQRERVAVPDVRNLPFSEAWEKLVFAGFDVKVVHLEPYPAPVMGLVVDQDPSPGTVARRNARVRLSVLHPRDEGSAAALEGDAGPRQAPSNALISVPDVRGLAFSRAWEILILSGFLVRVERAGTDPRPVVGKVTNQNPRPGSMAKPKTRVRLTVESRYPAGSALQP